MLWGRAKRKKRNSESDQKEKWHKKKKKNLENISQFLGTRAGGIFFKDEKKEKEGEEKKGERKRGKKERRGGNLFFYRASNYFPRTEYYLKKFSACGGQYYESSLRSD